MARGLQGVEHVLKADYGIMLEAMVDPDPNGFLERYIKGARLAEARRRWKLGPQGRRLEDFKRELTEALHRIEHAEAALRGEYHQCPGDS
jgi:hypothetical protein